MKPKPWYLSTKIWIAIIGVIGGLSASLSGVDALTIPGIVAAVLSAFVAILRIINGENPDEPDSPLTVKSPAPARFAAMALATVLLLSAAPACSGVQKQDVRPYVDASVDAAAIVGCGNMIEAWCGEGRPLHDSNTCADWKAGCALGYPIVVAIVDALFKGAPAPGSIPADEFARACLEAPLPLCDAVQAGDRVLMLPGVVAVQ